MHLWLGNLIRVVYSSILALRFQWVGDNSILYAGFCRSYILMLLITEIMKL
jgi:hypothetical protein